MSDAGEFFMPSAEKHQSTKYSKRLIPMMGYIMGCACFKGVSGDIDKSCY
ncbi:hypothetical protein Bhyg_08683 [Pseudolycoriella hygida]|uniref:Uncharacterized protein n=1 Tax=Pseudolycoriella hygida TaxID=35572 RepID=A0A9Q0N529_9DIPT|nr:hypothetical protein Bhyg_08683 [Pseudolycoriella hygida]